ncbi:MAG: efflux RND transporter permease subunit, partial [Candidatus Latescibacterota bacterium]
MNFSALFIRRPVMTTLVMLGILVFGLVGYRSLPVSDLPNIDFPTLQVSVSLPGATPETMASSVATPLERQFSTIAGLQSMNSTNALGSTQITLQFDLSRDLDAAAQDVQAAIAASLRQLPPDLPSPPSYRKVNPADQPILYISLTSSTLPLYQLNEYGETMLAERISMVNGVAQVLVFGSQKYAVRVQIDPAALASRGIGLDEVENAIRSANVNLPTGSLEGERTAFTVQASGRLLDAAAYEPVIVAYRGGKPVRLGDVGRVIDGVQNDRVAAWRVDQRAIVLAVQRQPGTNTVAVAKAVRDLLPSFREKLPGAVSLEVLFDRSQSIRESVHDVKFTLAFTLVLVVFVIFLFLRNISATLIPSLALPLSIVGSFAAMRLLGYSLDNLSLMALTLSLGFVVDDAIVMLENIVRHMEAGERRLEAALKGSKEIGFTILSMTLSLVAVFIPVLFMGGILGRLFNEFAVTIAVAILISGFVSLTLTPMMASLFLKPSAEAHHGRFYAVSERVFDRMLAIYEKGLLWSVRRKRFTLGYSAVILAISVLLFLRIPKGFMPSEDTGQIFGATESQEGTSFEAMVGYQQAAAAIVAEDPDVDAFMSNVGGGGRAGGSTTQGVLFIRLKPREERKSGPDEVIERLRPRLARIPGLRVFLQNPPAIRIGGQMTKSQYQFTIQGTDTRELYAHAADFETRVRDLPGLQDVTSDLRIRNPQLDILIDRDRASALGVSAEDVEQTLRGAYASGQISTIYAPNNQYAVILELLPERRLDPEALSALYVRSSTGRLVPLEAIAELRESVGPSSINHLGQFSAVTISFNLKPGFALGDAVGAVQDLAREVLPPNLSTSFQGTAEAFQSSLRGLGMLLIVAVLVIYLVLGILYESFIHPVTILSALPFAGFGALVTLMLFGVELNIYAFVGVIMLIGLVKKNGIMMIDFALDAQRLEGKRPADAIVQACLVRFRPIMMTTMAALVGTLPIAVGYGAGAESRQPLGLAVVGGLLFSQFLTLFVTPVFYIYM